MCSDLIARRLGSTSCSHVYLRDGLHVTYHNALPISTLRIATKQNRARGNLQPAHAGGMGFSRPLLQPEWDQHISVGLGLIPSRPELSGALGVHDVHSICSRCLDNTEKL